jgi:hypothetical protein
MRSRQRLIPCSQGVREAAAFEIDTSGRTRRAFCSRHVAIPRERSPRSSGRSRRPRRDSRGRTGSSRCCTSRNDGRRTRLVWWARPCGVHRWRAAVCTSRVQSCTLMARAYDQRHGRQRGRVLPPFRCRVRARRPGVARAVRSRIGAVGGAAAAIAVVAVGCPPLGGDCVCSQRQTLGRLMPSRGFRRSDI